MRRLITSLALLPLALVLTACPPPPGGPTPGTTSSCTFNSSGALVCAFSTTLAPMVIPGPGPTLPGAACPTGSQRLNTLTAAGTATIVLGANNDENEERLRVDVTVPGGTYTGSLSPIDPTDPTCTRVGPTVPLSGTWTAAHRSLVDKVRTPNCVFASNLAFTSTFTTPAGGPTLATPGPVEAAARTAVWFELDRLVADRIDGVRRPSAHTPLPAGASGRCAGDWRVMSEP